MPTPLIHQLRPSAQLLFALALVISAWLYVNEVTEYMNGFVAAIGGRSSKNQSWPFPKPADNALPPVHSNSGPSSLETGGQSQLDLLLRLEGPHLDHLEYCNRHNFLPQDGETVIQRNTNNSRPFSIRQEDFQAHHSRPCEMAQELLRAIKYGRRRWDSGTEAQNLSLLQRESLPSTFVPASCNIPYYSPKKMSAVLNRFSHVVIQGDSLSRHTHGGMLMGLRNDLIQGSLISSNPSLYKCRCDAQFSENKMCRYHDGLYNRFRPYQLGLCPEIEVMGQFEAVFNINRLHKGVYKFDGVNCTSLDSRGILVVVQGGVHLKYDGVQTYNMLLSRFLEDPVFRTCAKEKKAILIWTAYHAQSESYNDKYPLQAAPRGHDFNSKMAQLINEGGIQNLTTVDWLNFTMGAQHSDGLHYAAQVNYFKAQHLVAIADLMWREEMFINYPGL
jgi:hypothetical protein